MRSVLAKLRRPLLAGPAVLVATVAVFFSVLFVTEPAAHGANTVVSTDPSVIAAGQVLYQVHCQACHGYQGQGGVVNGAPELVDAGAAAADFYLTTGRMPLNAPNNEALRHHPYFNNQQISELVSYIAALPQINGTSKTGPGLPNVLPLCADQNALTPPAGSNCVTLSEGQQLYALNCAQCHQAAGSGAMLSKGNIVPGLHNANLEQAYEAPLIGPKPMPKFSGLSNSQLSAIAQYVQYLHKPSDPGGQGISHFGPVAEGFFAIGIGFVLLWFASRMIGNRG
jgi:ubiquinol-cytochrome c reductase cytochrome c subunit